MIPFETTLCRLIKKMGTTYNGSTHSSYPKIYYFFTASFFFSVRRIISYATGVALNTEE